MGDSVSVFNTNALTEAIKNVQEISEEVDKCCSDEISDSTKLFEDTEKEEKLSLNMLNGAKVIEGTALTLLIAKEAELVAASAEEAGAIASGNPILIAAASAKLAQVLGEFNEAKGKHAEAKAHRERLEHRHELSVKCLNIATRMLEFEKLKFGGIQLDFKKVAGEGSFRLATAKSDLDKYTTRMSPAVKKRFFDWQEWLPDKKVDSKELGDRLNIEGNLIQTILAYLYATDSTFRSNVNNYRVKGLIPSNRSDIEKEIKKTITGRLCEELATRSFGPMGKTAKTSGLSYIGDGKVIKFNLLIKNLKSAVTINDNETVAPAGADLLVEIFAGRNDSLFVNMINLSSKSSSNGTFYATVSTKDIKNLPSEKENELRAALKNSGSPLIGTIPSKNELDNECINFVFGDELNV